MINRLIELERKFWHYVETDTQPPADGSDSAAMALQCLGPNDRGNTRDCTEDRDMSSAFSDLVAIRAEIEVRETIEPELKQRIQQRMGEASRAKFRRAMTSNVMSWCSSAMVEEPWRSIPRG